MRSATCCLVCVVIMNLAVLTEKVNANAENIQYNRGMGILNIRSQSVAQSLRMTLPMLIPGDIKPGWTSCAGVNWTNVWAQERSYLLDYEMLDFYGGFSHGFNHKWGVSAIYDNRSYFGGALDGFIQGAHDIMGIDQNNREDFPKNRALLQIFDRHSGIMIDEMSARDLNNSGISFLINCNIFNGTPHWPSMNVYAVTRLALEHSEIFTHSDRLETGFGLGLAKRWTDHLFTYGVIGYSFHNNHTKDYSDSRLVLKKEQVNAMASMAWQSNDSWSFLLQYLYSSNAVKEIRGLRENCHELHLGLKYKIGRSRILDFSIIENIITMDNSPDFGLHVAIRQSF